MTEPINKPTKPEVVFPDNFGGIKTPYNETQITDGYLDGVPQLVDGGNINYEKDGVFKKLKYLETIADTVNGIPAGHTLVVNENNKFEYKEAGVKSANIGDIRFTSSKKVPACGVWCDGSTYSQEQFPELYSQLAKNTIVNFEMKEYNRILGLYGSCGVFGLDTTNKKFKVPSLNDTYLRAGQNFNAFNQQSLPLPKTKVTFQTRHGESGIGTNKLQGSDGDVSSSWGQTFTDLTAIKTVEDDTYRPGSKVNPDNVVYKAYVVVKPEVGGSSGGSTGGKNYLFTGGLISFPFDETTDLVQTMPVTSRHNTALVYKSADGGIYYTSPYITLVPIQNAYSSLTDPLSSVYPDEIQKDEYDMPIALVIGGVTYNIDMNEEAEFTFIPNDYEQLPAAASTIFDKGGDITPSDNITNNAWAWEANGKTLSTVHYFYNGSESSTKDFTGNIVLNANIYSSILNNKELYSMYQNAVLDTNVKSMFYSTYLKYDNTYCKISSRSPYTYNNVYIIPSESDNLNNEPNDRIFVGTTDKGLVSLSHGTLSEQETFPEYTNITKIVCGNYSNDYPVKSFVMFVNNGRTYFYTNKVIGTIVDITDTIDLNNVQNLFGVCTTPQFGAVINGIIYKLSYDESTQTFTKTLVYTTNNNNFVKAFSCDNSQGNYGLGLKSDGTLWYISETEIAQIKGANWTYVDNIIANGRIFAIQNGVICKVNLDDRKPTPVVTRFEQYGNNVTQIKGTTGGDIGLYSVGEPPEARYTVPEPTTNDLLYNDLEGLFSEVITDITGDTLTSAGGTWIRNANRDSFFNFTPDKYKKDFASLYPIFELQNSKANTSLDNINQYGREVISNINIPDYSLIETVSLPYTAENNGMLFIKYKNGSVEFKINGVQSNAFKYSTTSTELTGIEIILAKGDVIELVSGTVDSYFFVPFKK